MPHLGLQKELLGEVRRGKSLFFPSQSSHLFGLSLGFFCVVRTKNASEGFLNGTAFSAQMMTCEVLTFSSSLPLNHLLEPVLFGWDSALGPVVTQQQGEFFTVHFAEKNELAQLTANGPVMDCTGKQITVL